ncbi:XF1762 family protein [Streptacidiphilus sp. EB103A]|uniref:XF1762 family protein n=1 Tax=Streptacidiphilus sp. EB103A TaxID=3156275 RepID=UPI003519B29D
MALTVIPLTFAQACIVVDRLHRHHRRPQGHRYSLGVVDADGILRGAAIIGRPVARALDDGWTVEVTRVATDGTPNANSALLGGCWRVAAACGFRRAITYTQSGESGASLRGAGWRNVAELRPRAGWSTPSRPRLDRGTDGLSRTMWERTRSNAVLLPVSSDLLLAAPCPHCGASAPIGRGRPAACCKAAQQGVG